MMCFGRVVEGDYVRLAFGGRRGFEGGQDFVGLSVDLNSDISGYGFWMYVIMKSVFSR
jgi:hypothetical protein